MTRTEAFRIFELDDRCTPEQVRATYRGLVKVWHPDRFANDAGLRTKADRRLQEINCAYAVLQDRAETVETPRDATSPPPAPPPPDVATPRSAHHAPPGSADQSTSAGWSLARLAIVGLVAGAAVVGIVLMLVRLSQHGSA